MTRRVLLIAVAGLASLTAAAGADETLRPAAERFANADSTETPDFRRQVLPLFGRLGCNGRACHGAFQGQAGFRLSLFGYDHAADHQALAGGERPRVDRAWPRESLLLVKPTLAADHEGGQPIEPDSWQYHLLLRWIEAGGGPAQGAAEFDHLEVTPAKIRLARPGDSQQLGVTACWSDGTREDVTCLARFRSNDESVATIDENGLVRAVQAGDTHVVVFYDNDVAPLPVITPTSDLADARYPDVPAPTEIDQLVVHKLRELGIVPSELASDAEFLRRASLDVTGTSPLPDEIEAFLADPAADKRLRKIDELLARPSYAAWWTTRLCEDTGGGADQLGEGPFDGQRSAVQWYAWLYRRVAENRPYDEIAADIILGTSRKAGQSYDDYCRTMNGCYGDDSGQAFAALDTLPHFWMRRDTRKPHRMAEAFAHTFLGIQLQCAQCHKHPFDRWTKRDYDDFAAVFRRVKFGVAADAKSRFELVRGELEPDGKKVDLAKDTPALIAADRQIPWREVFAAPPPRPKPGAGGPAAPLEPARLLEGEPIDVGQYADPRQALVDWLRRDADRYFARALVNRVWAAYFHRGIVEPPDDLSRANPPSNGPLLDYLTREFIAHRYDLKWLHRTIVASRTYQLSWRPNETNALDRRNFSHAIPRRLPAEVAYNALLQATAGREQLAELERDPRRLATGPPSKTRLPKANYALKIFGRPTRATPFDCQRSGDATLLQTLFLQNDHEMLALLDRPDGWVNEVGKQRAAQGRLKPLAERLLKRQGQLAQLDQQAAAAAAGSDDKPRSSADAPRTEESQTDGPQSDESPSDDSQMDSRRADERRQIERDIAALGAELERATADAPSERQAVADRAALVREAYLRALGRPATKPEIDRAIKHLDEASEERAGLRDLVWALLNTKEFILNH